MEHNVLKQENKVKGCQSTVFVHATMDENGIVTFQGDSDSQLTKGLVALLIRGLSNCTADEIQRVPPSFIHDAGLAVSLTPSRNNGFVNMLATMKRQALLLAAERAAAAAAAPSSA
mmetsp:Transcript_70702/g.188729  ORF Transcript_70702/g.188729 Transcript_70702/m.188729 type:complete len:116 (+) Transcript_70702:349-696(+)